MVHFKTRILSLAALLLTLTTTPSLVHAKYECNTSLGNFYPYCINIPDHASNGNRLPTILMLSGSGARGPASQVRMLSGYDGFGKLINRYQSGNRGEAYKTVAEEFITIIPIMPKYANGQEQRHFFPQHIDKIYDQLKQKGTPIDWDRLYCAGFSAGARSCARQAVERPNLYAAFSNAAGPAEKPGAGTLSQQYATSVSDKFERIKNLPVLQFAGLYDNTVGQSSPKEQQAAFDRVGNKNAKTIWLQADHNKMSTMPFEDMRMLNFFKSCRRNGGGGAAASNDYAPIAEEKKADDEKNKQGQEQKKGDEDNKKSDEEQKKENKDEDKKVSSEKNLSPATSSGDSSSHKQFNAELDSSASQPQTQYSKEKEADASIGETQVQTPAKTEAKAPSSGHCKKRSAKKQRMIRRSIGEEGYAHPGPIRRGIYTLTSEEEIVQRSSRPALESSSHSLAQEKKKTKRGLSLNEIIQNVESLRKMEVKRSPLESLKAHAGSRRSLSHDSSSHKLRRR